MAVIGLECRDRPRGTKEGRKEERKEASKLLIHTAQFYNKVINVEVLIVLLTFLLAIGIVGVMALSALPVYILSKSVICMVMI